MSEAIKVEAEKKKAKEVTDDLIGNMNDGGVEKVDPEEELNLSISESDILKVLKTFAKGMKPAEMERYRGIYAKYQSNRKTDPAEVGRRQVQTQ